MKTFLAAMALTVVFLLALLILAVSVASHSPARADMFDEQLALNFARGAAFNLAFAKYCNGPPIDPRQWRTAVAFAGAEQIRTEVDSIERRAATMGPIDFCTWGIRVTLRSLAQPRWWVLR